MIDARCSVTAICPVNALTELVLLKGSDRCKPDESVFTYIKNGMWVYLTKLVAGKFRAGQLQAMGLESKKYGLHSFRIGNLQQGLVRNNSIAFLKLHSDHHSSAKFGYLHLSASEDAEWKIAWHRIWQRRVFQPSLCSNQTCATCHPKKLLGRHVIIFWTCHLVLDIIILSFLST